MSGIQSQKPSTKVRKKLLRIKKTTHGLHNKYSVLDVAGVLNPLKYAPTWIACAKNLIQVPDKR